MGEFAVVQALSWWQNAPRDPSEDTKKNPLPSWANHCIRCDPATHRCRGFFLCRLDRVGMDAAKALGKRERRLRNQAMQKKKKRRKKPKDVPNSATSAVAKSATDNSQKAGK